ncbi:MAG TPA: hypothetical protein VGS07_00880 [Thermoanaerobaculia bacterium]|nr:hypothetical protein [Thermoanaerobaculia bacterium]
MRIKKLFFPLLGAAVLGGIGAGFLSSFGTVTVQADFTDAFRRGLQQQSRKTRIWRQGSAHKTLTISSGPGYQLYGPLVLKIDASDALYVLDVGDVKIKKFSPEGRFLASYGKGRGQGPGEFASLADFAVGPRGEVWAADLSNGRLTVFEPNGDVARTLKLETPPYRITFGKDSLFVMLAPVGDRLFAEYGLDGRLRRSFGTFLANQGRNAMVLDGWLAPADDGGFVYAGLYAGLIAAYDLGGNPRFLAEALDRPPLPKVVRDGKRTWVDREASTPINGMSVTPGKIHILSTYLSALRRVGSIDTFDAGDGRYLFSRHVPEKCLGVVVSPRYLYTFDDTHVTRWQLDS